MTTTSEYQIPEAALREIDKWIAKYPVDQKRSAVIPALHVVQDHHDGWLSEAAMDALAQYLELPRIVVYEVATFYSMYELKPVGKNKLCVCNSLSCCLNGADELLSTLKDKLGVGPGESTEDGKFYVKTVECLGACVGAPAMQVNKVYHEGVTPEQLTKIVDQLASETAEGGHE